MTRRQKLFVKEYLIDLNATQAAIRAGYSKKTAGRTGYENLKKPEIAKAIQKAMNDRAEKLDISDERILKEIAEMAFAEPTKELNYSIKLKALELLGKHKVLFTEKIQHTGEVTIDVGFDDQSED